MFVRSCAYFVYLITLETVTPLQMGVAVPQMLLSLIDQAIDEP